MNSQLHSLYNWGGGGVVPRLRKGKSGELRREDPRFLSERPGTFGLHGVFIVTWQREEVCRAWALGARVGKARGDWDAERLGAELGRRGDNEGD